MKIIHFTSTVPFVNTTLDWAVKNIPTVLHQCECPCHYTDGMMHFAECCSPRDYVKSYTYNDLQQNNVKYDEENCVLILEAGQTQRCHTNNQYDLKRFKQKFPNSKIVLFASDSIYYEVNRLKLQFGYDVKPDLILEVMPQSVEFFRELGFSAELIPWTISRKLWHYLRKLSRPQVDFSRKNNDFISLMSHSCEYRSNMRKYLTDQGYSYISGGDHDDKNIEQTYQNFLNSWINIETSSHNRPELTLLGCQKGFRAAAGIALNCLTTNDNHPNNKLCGMEFPEYEYGKFYHLMDMIEFYKRDYDKYQEAIQYQQQWLENNLLDYNIVKALEKYKIL